MKYLKITNTYKLATTFAMRQYFRFLPYPHVRNKIVNHNRKSQYQNIYGVKGHIEIAACTQQQHPPEKHTNYKD